MTTFADREHAIEAHYVARELAAFSERSRRYRRLGFRLAALFNLHSKEARRFAVRLSEQCINEPSDEYVYRRMANELRRQGLTLSESDIRRMAVVSQPSDQDAPAPLQVGRPWIEFLTSELLALFTATPNASEGFPRQSQFASAR